MDNMLSSLAKNILVPLELTTAKLATDAAFQKRKFRLGMAGEMENFQRNCKNHEKTEIS